MTATKPRASTSDRLLGFSAKTIAIRRSSANPARVVREIRFGLWWVVWSWVRETPVVESKPRRSRKVREESGES